MMQQVVIEHARVDIGNLETNDFVASLRKPVSRFKHRQIDEVAFPDLLNVGAHSDP